MVNFLHHYQQSSSCDLEIKTIAHEVISNFDEAENEEFMALLPGQGLFQTLFQFMKDDTVAAKEGDHGTLVSSTSSLDGKPVASGTLENR